MVETSKLHSMLEKIGSRNDKEGLVNRGVDIALGIVTVSRNRHFLDSYEPHYLTQVIKRFFSGNQSLVCFCRVGTGYLLASCYRHLSFVTAARRAGATCH